jgi:hypothetical protein
MPTGASTQPVELPALSHAPVPIISGVERWGFDATGYASAVGCDATAADDIIRALGETVSELTPLTNTLRHVALLASPLPYHGALLSAQALQALCVLFKGAPALLKSLDVVERAACLVAVVGCHASLSEARAEPITLKYPGDSPIQRFHAGKVLQHLASHDSISIGRDWSEADRTRFNALCATLILRTDPVSWGTWVPHVQRRVRALNLNQRGDRADVASVLVLAAHLSVWHGPGAASWLHRHSEEGLGSPSDVVKGCGLTALTIVGEFAEDWLGAALPRSAPSDFSTTRASDVGVDVDAQLAAAVAENANLLELSLSYQTRVKELLVENAALAEIVSHFS